MNRKMRAAAIALCILFSAFIILSLTFIAEEAGHDCSGEDCPFCEQIAFLSHIVRSITGLVLVAAAALFVENGIKKAFYPLKRVYSAKTPVTLKIRLLN